MEKVTTWIAARPQLVIPGLIDSTQYECHLTLAFLGDADPAAVKAAVDAGRSDRVTLGETTCKWWRPQSYYD